MLYYLIAGLACVGLGIDGAMHSFDGAPLFLAAGFILAMCAVNDAAMVRNDL